LKNVVQYACFSASVRAIGTSARSARIQDDTAELHICFLHSSPPDEANAEVVSRFEPKTAMPKSQTLPIRSHMLSLLIALYPCRLMIFNLGSSQLGGFLVRPLAGFKRKAFVPRSDFSKSNAQTSCACRHSQFAIACTASKAPGEPGENPARDAHWL